MNRTHKKYHANNHHTDATAGDIGSALDPIASENHPFIGDFYLSNSITISGDLSVSGDVSFATPIVGLPVATTATKGIIRIALSTDTSSVDKAVCPKDIEKFDGVLTPHDLISEFHTDIDFTTPPEDGNVLFRENNTWIPASPHGIGELATDAEAAAGLIDDKPISVSQLRTEIFKRKPLFTTSSNLPSPNGVRDGVLLIQSYKQDKYHKSGNGNRRFRWYGIRVYECQSNAWVSKLGNPM